MFLFKTNIRNMSALALIQMMEDSPFREYSLLSWIEAMKVTIFMAHFQEKGWLYIILYSRWKQSMRSSFNFAKYRVFDQTFSNINNKPTQPKKL